MFCNDSQKIYGKEIRHTLVAKEENNKEGGGQHLTDYTKVKGYWKRRGVNMAVYVRLNVIAQRTNE